MGESEVEEALRRLSQDAFEPILKSGDPWSDYQFGIAFYDSERDSRFTALKEFHEAVRELQELPIVDKLYGRSEASRLILQFLYGLFGALDHAGFDNAVFDKTWDLFRKELFTHEWTYAIVSNLQNFGSTSGTLELGEGITIRHRSFKELAKILSWTNRELKMLGDDWSQGAASKYVVVVTENVPKTPDNLVMSGGPTLLTKLGRILLAMRLLKMGDIRTGRVFHARPALFNFGLGGMMSSGFTIWHPGKEYALIPSEVQSIRDLYDLLTTFEAKYAAEFRNLALCVAVP